MNLHARDAVIVDGIRTPMARSKEAFLQRPGEELSAILINALFERNPGLILRKSKMLSGGVLIRPPSRAGMLPVMRHYVGAASSTCAQTVNRLCGSSMSALHTAASAIQSDNGDQFIVGGVEHMGHVGMTYGIDPNPKASKHIAKAAWMMGVTAEVLSKMHGISRERQDAFAVRSHSLLNGRGSTEDSTMK